MARFGVSPTRNKVSDYHPSRVTAAVLTYLPQSTGYYRHRLDVIRLCLESLIQTSAGQCDIMVFDNGSAPAVVDYLKSLHQAKEIDILMLSSRNLGNWGALQMMFSAAPGEIVAYCDDDILFYPGWLQAQLDILEAYPNVGVVSGVPVRNSAERAVQSNLQFAAGKPAGLTVKTERWIADEWEQDWAESTGRDLEQHKETYKNHQDQLWTMSGIPAFPAANHFQFIGPKDVLLKALPANWTGRLMGNMAEVDQVIDEMGCLRLSTTRRYVRHIGNVVSESIADDARTIVSQVDSQQVSKRAKKHWILHIPRMRPFLQRIYSKLFDILYHVDR